MAKNTMTRNIPLEAVCDLTNQQGVANYEGFKAKNSFFMNGRLCPWWRRKADDGYLTGGLSYRTNDDSFSIMKDGKEVMEISRTRYSVEKCESLPSLSPCTNPYPDSDDYVWMDFYSATYEELKDSFIFGCEYENKDAFLITSPKGSSYQSSLFVYTEGAWKCVGYWTSGGKYVFMGHIREEISATTTFWYYKNQVDQKNKKLSKETVEGIPITAGYYVTEFLSFPAKGKIYPTDYDLESANSFFQNNAHTYKLTTKNFTTPPFSRVVPDTSFDYATGEKKSSSSGSSLPGIIVPTLPAPGSISFEDSQGSTSGSDNDFFVIMSYEGDIIRFVINEYDNKFSLFIPKGITAPVYYLNSGRSDGSNCYLVNTNLNVVSFKREILEETTQTRKKSDRYYITRPGKDDAIIQDCARATEVKSLRTLHPENYSKKFGEFAINYVKNQEYSIGHGYKKILQLDEEEILGYTEDSIYYEKDGVNYRLFMERCDRPQFTVLDDDCVVFNTTTYNNAYHLIFDTVFCSSDDWNNRAQWYVTEYSENWRMLNSRLNQNWQTRKKILSVSTQFSSITQRLATRTETVNGEEQRFSDPTKMNVFYIDDSYTCPEGVEYDVFFEDAITSSVGSLVKQGTLSASGFTVAKDEGMIFSEPGTDENQENIPVLGFSFTSFNGSVLVKVGDFAYMCLKQPMLGNTFVPLYQMSETGYSATTYIQFAINGQLFSYYPKTSQIIDSNDQFVCDTSTFVYLGYSSRCAYFYCLMDKSVYTFTGDNTMNRLYPIERLTLQLASVSELDKETKVGDTLNIPSLDFVVVNFKTGFGVLYDSQFCLVSTDKEIPSGTMTVDKNNAAVNVNGTNYSLISQDGYESVPIEFETQFYGDASGESNMVNDAVYFELTNYNGKSEGKITVQTVALVNGAVKEGAKRTISVGKSDFNKAGVARVRYQPDIQECRGFKLKVVSDFEIASMKIGCEAGALAQPKVRM